ncbi:NUDIX hydrolase [Candidatus Woesearchaeota archaeon CG11_big_fil_rev_8_21_14_0_20_43_8]|nr:MAG: NUDIX hydrolase [Candidatus Woesearchaeota archaeon CG11_big_fil_rev_8_21_14_0_20_43_8]PIO06910.1 MAG: NUDIX hydrolase [Candidatus Woesearchaeota archaeon CG08_land_8_20_14_0_20_43_7]
MAQNDEKIEIESFQRRYKPQYHVTTDAAVFTIKDEALHVLLIKRKNPPFKESYALPGGFVEADEDLDRCAARELAEETNVKDIYLEQIGAFGNPSRDPRGRVITIAYLALIDWNKVNLAADTDAMRAEWLAVKRLPKLAFDHKDILESALDTLKDKIKNTSIAFQLLPKEFTLTELQKTHEAVLGMPIDKRNFRKKILSENFLVELKKTKMVGAHRPAKLYQFKEK